MKCPIFRAANLVGEFDADWSGDNCLQTECAWWDDDLKCCVGITLACRLQELTDSNHDILAQLEVMTKR